MKLVMLILLGTVGLFGQALPDPKLTPGEVRTTNISVVCHGGPTKLVRHTTAAMKRAVCTEYRASPCPRAGAMEIDHLIPLELGGADDIKNLWVQYAPDYHWKDHLENFLHREVCAGRIPLAESQAEIARDWVASYRARIGPLPSLDPVVQRAD